MKLPGVLRLALGAVLVTLLACSTLEPVAAQTAEDSLKQSCPGAVRAFSLRQAGTEALAVADPSATGKLRQAALLFYRCAQSESDPYEKQLFLAYYANTLYKVGQNTNDQRAVSLAVKTALGLSSSQFDDIHALVAPIHASPPPRQSKVTTASETEHSSAYCNALKGSILRSLEAIYSATSEAADAGTNDTQVLAATTARYGGAFKAVEDDYGLVEGNLGDATSALSQAEEVMTTLNPQEKQSVEETLQAITATIRYTDTYNRLALAFERGINGTNRQLTRARVQQALASQQHDTSYTYSNDNAFCSSYSYNTSCNGSSYSTTTYNNSATIAQQNASAALTAAESGRLSYSGATDALEDGLTNLQRIKDAVASALQSWNTVCATL